IGATLAEYSHILSFRRQVYIAPSENTDIPESIEITHNDLTYRIFLTLDSQKCYKCKLIGHIASQCPSIQISQTSTESETLNDELSNPSENQVVSDITTEDSTTAHIHLPKENTKSITNKNSHQHPQNTNTNIISLHGEGTPNNDELITPSVSSKRSFSEILTPTEDTGAPQSYQVTFTKPTADNIKKHKPDQELTIPIKSSLEPIKNLIETQQTVLNIDQLTSLLENVHGAKDAITVVNNYTSDFRALIEMLLLIYPHLTNRTIKNRCTRLRKKLEHHIDQTVGSLSDTSSIDSTF
ncbi:unnamed protein product, partial [Acanthoscelides obtectus]